jgi:arabinan endo-1,5-alpha-L-arabinosidase
MRSSTAAAAALSLLALSPARGVAQVTDVPIHDPVLIEAEGTSYLFGTGRGLVVWASRDRTAWEELGPVFPTSPPWVLEILPRFRNEIWAPDIIERDGTFYLYYSVSAFGRNTSAIGVATNATLDPADPAFRWTDHGIVVQSVPGRDLWNAIDPHLVVDREGTPWLSFGSHWGGIKLVKMDPSLTSVAEPQEWHTIAARNRYWKLDDRDAGDSANPELDYEHLYPPRILEMNRLSENGAIEAPVIFWRDGYYYLFVSWDRCCRGVESTYKVVVGRSREITGPYLDREDENLAHGGGTLVVQGFGEGGRWVAGGHNDVATAGPPWRWRRPMALDNPPGPRAVLWDLDGTLADSKAYHWRSWQEALGAVGVSVTEAQFEASFGQRNDAILSAWLGAGADPELILRVGGDKEARYREMVRTGGVEPLPGAAEWVTELHAQGWRQAIASSAPRLNVEAMHRALGFGDRIQALVAAEDVRRGKPEPDVFLEAALRLGASPPNCVVVEDAEAGIEAARRAGMASIGVGPGAVSAADRVVRSLVDLPSDAFRTLLERRSD